MKVEITQEDIDKADQRRSLLEGKGDYDISVSCPTALALRRLFPNATNIRVGFEQVYIDGRELDIPREAEGFIFRWTFRPRNYIRPITFEIED